MNVEFTVSMASAEQFAVVCRFLQEYFFKEIPVTRMFGLEGEELPDIPDVAEFILKAEDPEGQLVGVAFNTSRPTPLWDREKSPGQKQVVEFFEFFESDARLHELPDSLVEVWLVGVHPQWRGRGVARALVEASEREAKSAGFSLIAITGVSEYISRLAQRLGWKLHYNLKYSEYPRLSGRDVQLKPYTPHETLSYYVKEL